MFKKGQKQNEELVVEEGEEGASFRDRLKKLREELKECRKEKEEYLLGWQRAKADFINARKEEEKNRQMLIKFAEGDVIRELLAVLDSFEGIFNGANWSSLDNDWQSGIKNMHNQLMKILQGRGLLVIDALGRSFNPEEHESVEEVLVDDESRDNMVLEEVGRGYKFYDLVLRPARVKVGRFKELASAEGGIAKP